MKYIIAFILSLTVSFNSFSQNKMTPELLWSLGRVSGTGLSKDGKNIVYSVSTPNIQENKSKKVYYSIPLQGGNPVVISNPDSLVRNKNISPNGKYIVYDKEVKITKVRGTDFYPELIKSNAYIYNDLDYRHWDTWNEGQYNHVFVASLEGGKKINEKDLMPGEPYYSPQRPFGGDEDYIWSPDSKYIIYVSKKKTGKAYTFSTNTDLYQYNIETGTTTNLTEGMLGYDQNPAYSATGTLAWLSMRRDGFEADKQDLVIIRGNEKINLTQNRDDIHVSGFKWSNDGKEIYFWAPVKATDQLFKVSVTAPYTIKQITNGEHQIGGIIAESGNELFISRTDMNHAAELFAVNKTNGKLRQLTHVNDAIYNNLSLSKTEKRTVTTVDGKQMPTWVIYPPDFDPNKKYPTLLFCLGGPQGTTPHYSMRWNFQLMAAQGYIVVAPDRRGVFGNGTQWTEQVSKDWGGLVIQDYLSAIDAVSKEAYVDKDRLGCVGASFGGFSVFMLEAVHNKRFKTFISHDGVFDFRSMYGTTDEMFFETFEKGGAYWEKDNAVAQRSFSQSPSNFVDKWDTPILIVQGGKDYRVPIEQGLQAFQAAQIRGIKSRLLYLPDENHWVLSAQNAMVWQHEFFKWLKETL
ncbi:MAG TPA: S9 family peptidase [Daejeonella sp.]|nr:S9 family peptidase [Daejeonella sp.]